MSEILRHTHVKALRRAVREAAAWRGTMTGNPDTRVLEEFDRFVARAREGARLVEEARSTLTLIHRLLDGKEWDLDTTSVIADHLRDYGLEVRDPDGCDCDDRSWHGDVHDSACPLAGLNRP